MDHMHDGYVGWTDDAYGLWVCGYAYSMTYAYAYSTVLLKFYLFIFMAPKPEWRSGLLDTILICMIISLFLSYGKQPSM